MADTKRNSVGVSRSGTTTPKAGAVKGPAATGPGELDFSKIIGARIKLTTSSPMSQTFEGTIFTADPITNLLVLNTSLLASASTPASYMLVPTSRIHAFTFLAAPPTAADAPTTPATTMAAFENAAQPISKLDVNALKAREANAIRKQKERDATIGKGVTKEAQEIFDALSRTLPARWHDANIIVNDNVVIKPPYTPDNCSAAKGQDAALTRLKRVLEAERKKIATRSASTGAGEAKASESNGRPAAAPAAANTISNSTSSTVRGSGAGALVVATPLPKKGG